MTQQQRTLLAIALSFGLMVVYNTLVTKPAAEEAARLAAAVDGGTRLSGGALDGGDALAAVVTAPVGTALDAGAAPMVAQPAVAIPPRVLELDRPSMKLTFTSEGAGLTDAVLKGRRERVEQALSIADGYKKLLGGTFAPPAQVDMAEPLTGGVPQLGLSISGATPVPATQRYAVVQEAPGLVEFVTTVEPFEVHKTFRWSPTATTSEKDPSGYLSSLEVTVKNVAAVAAGGDLVIHTARSINPGDEQAPSMFGGIGNESSVVCLVGDDVKRERPKDEGVPVEDKGAVSFVGIDQTYFLTAVRK